MVPPPQYQRRRQRPNNPLQTATTVAAAAVAAYGTYRLASWAWDSFWNNTSEQTEHDEACVENSRAGQHPHHASQHSTPLRHGASPASKASAQKRRRRHALIRQHRIARCRTETTAALADFLPTLRQTIERSTDFGAETAGNIGFPCTLAPSGARATGMCSKISWFPILPRSPLPFRCMAT